MENMATEVKEMRKQNYVYKKQIDKRKSEPKRRSKVKEMQQKLEKI